jgi:hypothetical protein
LFLAADGLKTRTCPYCGVRVDLQRAKKLASASTAFEASEKLRELKSKNQSNSRQPKLK